MNAGGRLFGHAFDCLGGLAVPAGLLFKPFLDRDKENLFFLVSRVLEHAGIGFCLHAEMKKQRGIAAIVENHVGSAAVVPLENAVRVIPIVLQALAFDREDRHAGIRDGCGGMILGRVDVAGRPAHIRAKMRQCLDENRGLDRHVERTGDSRAAQWLLRPILLPRCHQAGHLGFRNIDLVPAPGRERNIFDDVVAGLCLWLGSGHGNPSTHELGVVGWPCL